MLEFLLEENKKFYLSELISKDNENEIEFFIEGYCSIFEIDIRKIDKIDLSELKCKNIKLLTYYNEIEPNIIFNNDIESLEINNIDIDDIGIKFRKKILNMKLPDKLKKLTLNRIIYSNILPNSLNEITLSGSNIENGLPNNILSLCVSYNEIDNFKFLLNKNIKYLNLYTLYDNIELDYLPENLEILQINNCNFEKISCEFPKNLKILGIYDSPIKLIPKLPDYLENFILIRSKIEEINYFPNTLNKINIAETKLNSIGDIVCDELKELCLFKLQLNKLPIINCPKLEYLNFSYNNIEDINIKLKNFKLLKFLEFNYNKKINIIPELPDNIEELKCRSCNINYIKNIPKSCKLLIINDNKIEELPTLYNSLEEIYCYNNKLNKLNNLPNKLKILLCENNNINEIEYIPESLINFDVNNNPLKYIPALNNNMYFTFFGEVEYISGVEEINFNDDSMFEIKIKNTDIIINNKIDYNKYIHNKLLNKCKSARR